MLENIREKIRKMEKEADERNIKSWQKHPRLNLWIIYIYATCLSGFATTLLARALLGYIQYNPIVATCFSVMLYGMAIWFMIAANWYSNMVYDSSK